MGSDIKIEGPWTDRDGVIVPVSPGRRVALGSDPGTPGLLRLSHGSGDDGAVRWAAEDGSYWTIEAGSINYGGRTDQLWCHGYNTGIGGGVVDPTKLAFLTGWETDYDPVPGGLAWTEWYIQIVHPAGFSIRPITVGTETPGSTTPGRTNVRLAFDSMDWISAGAQKLGIGPTTEWGATTKWTLGQGVALYRAGNNEHWLVQQTSGGGSAHIARIDADDHLELGYNCNTRVHKQLRLGTYYGVWECGLGAGGNHSLPEGYPQLVVVDSVAAGGVLEAPAPIASRRGMFWVIHNRGGFEVSIRLPPPASTLIHRIEPRCSCIIGQTQSAWVVLSDTNQSRPTESYTLAQLLAGTPAPTPAGKQVWCSDHTGGARLAYSDGATWRDVRTGNVVA